MLGVVALFFKEGVCIAPKARKQKTLQFKLISVKLQHVHNLAQNTHLTCHTPTTALQSDAGAYVVAGVLNKIKKLDGNLDC